MSIKDSGKIGAPITVHIPIPMAGPQVQKDSNPCVISSGGGRTRKFHEQNRMLSEALGGGGYILRGIQL